jgi:hypothetical protein
MRRERERGTIRNIEEDLAPVCVYVRAWARGIRIIMGVDYDVFFM